MKMAKASQADLDAATAQSSADRTAKDYAIEHAEYMAVSAENLLDAINRLNGQRDEDDEVIDESELAAAAEDVSEAFSAVREGIYEFRKRRDRANDQATPAQSDKESVRNAALDEAAKIPRQYAEQLDAGIFGARFPEATTHIFNASTNMADKIRALKSQSVQHPDDAAVDAFAGAMKAKLAKKRGEGYGGWNTTACTQRFLSDLLIAHVMKGDPVDIANLSMMLHQRGESVDPTPPEKPTQTISTALPPNIGHGHVHPRADGIKARCGGPGICSECSKDAASKAAMQSREGS